MNPTQHKLLGKIARAEFGLGGYQDQRIGIHIRLQGEAWAIDVDNSDWDSNCIKVTETTKWTEEHRTRNYGDIVRYVSDLLTDAKASRVSELTGKPIEAILEWTKLVSWRILKEVL